MAKSDDIKSQLELTNELNKALEKQLALQQKLNSGASRQAQIQKDICDSGKSAGGSSKQQVANQRRLTQEIEKTKQASKDMTNQLQEGMKKSGGAVGGFKSVLGSVGKFMMSWKGMALGIFGGLIGGITKIFSGLVGAIKGIFSLITSTIKVSMGIIKGLIMAPFKLMSHFNGLANQLKDIQVVINGARQAVNGMIGDHKTLGSVTNAAYKTAKKAVQQLPGGVFGPREQGAAERIKLAGELVKAFGPYQNELAKLSKSGAKFAIHMKKNLGFTDENFQKIAGVSKAYGKDLNEEFKTVTLGIAAVAEAGGLNIKELGKEFNTFYAKLGPMTGMATHKIVEMAGAFSKMGISADKALGMFDKFDDLEGGAEVVSKMSRSLGIHVSQTDMIMAREKGPLEQLRIVQDAMRSAGKSFEDLSYDGKKMVTEMFGGDSAVAMKAFSESGMESSDSIEKAAAAAKKAKDARDMPKLMQKLNKSIQGVADSFGRIMKPLEAFMTGFLRGMAKSKDGKGFVNNMKAISKTFEDMGSSAGKYFGDNGIFTMITDSLKSFAKKIQGVMPLIKELMDALFSDKPTTKRSPWEIVKEIGAKLFGAYGDFYSGITKMLVKAAGKIVPVLIRIVAWLGETINDQLMSIMDGSWGKKSSSMFDKLGKAFKFDNEGVAKEWDNSVKQMKKSYDKHMGPKTRTFMKTDDKGNVKKITKKAGLGEALGATFMTALKKSANKLGEIFGKMLLIAFKYIWDNHAGKIVAGLAVYLFGPALLKALAGKMLASAGASALGPMMGSALTAAGPFAGKAAAVAAAGAIGYYGAKWLGADTFGEYIGDSWFEALNPAANSWKASAEENEKYWKERAARAKKEADKKKIDDMYADINKSIKDGSKDTLDLLEMKIKADTQKTANEKEQLIANINKKRKQIDEAELNAARNKEMRDSIGESGMKALMTKGGMTEVTKTSSFKGNQEIITQQGGMSQAGWAEFQRLKSMEFAAREMGQDTKNIVAAQLKFMNGNQESLDAMNALHKRAMQRSTEEGYDTKALMLKMGKYHALIAAGVDKGTAATMIPGGISSGNKSWEQRQMHNMQSYLYMAQNSPEQVAQRKQTIKQVDLALRLITAKGKDADALKNLAKMKLSDAQLKELKLEAYIPQIQAARVAAEKAAAAAAAQGAPPSATAPGQPKAGGVAVGKKDAKKLEKIAASAGAKVQGVKTKPPKKLRQLGRLPPSVLRLLASKTLAKRMFDNGLEMTKVMDKLGPAAAKTSDVLIKSAAPALNQTATAANQATSSLATTVVMLTYVKDKLLEIQKAYTGIMDSVVTVSKEGAKMKGKHSAKVTTETGTLTVNIGVSIDSKQMTEALTKGPVVTWSGNAGPQ